MKAVAYHRLDDTQSVDVLEDVDLPRPTPGPIDLRVKIEAVSVNPVDYKIRTGVDPAGEPGILGYDASGIVDSVGDAVTGFAPGDAVYYAGAVNRPGTNAEFHCVDHRIVARKPQSLSHTEAAALPLTALTAWELLFDRFRISEGGGKDDALVVVGAAGGVGSVMIQLARALTDLRVIATASRPDTEDWVTSLGAHDIINHRRDLASELEQLGVAPRYAASLTAPEQHFEALVSALEPQGYLGFINAMDRGAIDITAMMQKSLTLCWEYMFTRPVFATRDIARQGEILRRVAELVDAGQVRTTLQLEMSPINAENLRQAHTLQESGRAIGKTVLSGF